MSTIIAGRFEQQTGAEQAVVALEAAGFDRTKISAFFVTPAGQHDIGDFEDPDPSGGARHAGTGAAAGATLGGGVGIMTGLATAPLLGPGAALAGAALGAYVGSLAGALSQTEDAQPNGRADSSTRPRQSGILVAVAAADKEQESTAIALLHQHDAHEVERAEGTITNGDWSDFDPLRSPVPAERSTERRL